MLWPCNFRRHCGVVVHDSATKGGFPLIPGMKRKKCYIRSEAAAGDSVAYWQPDDVKTEFKVQTSAHQWLS